MTTGKRAKRTKLDFRCPICRSAIGQAKKSLSDARQPEVRSSPFKICLDANKFVLLSFFSLIKTIYTRVSTKLLPNDAKSPLPIEKTLLLKLPNRYYVPFSGRNFDCQANEKIEPDIRLVLYLTSGSLLGFLAVIVFCLSWVSVFLVSVVLVIFFYTLVGLVEYKHCRLTE